MLLREYKVFKKRTFLIQFICFDNRNLLNQEVILKYIFIAFPGYFKL